MEKYCIYSMSSLVVVVRTDSLWSGCHEKTIVCKAANEQRWGYCFGVI